MTDEKTYKMVLCKGVEGNSVYLNDYRIAGPKPLGGGPIIKTWTVTRADIFRAIKEADHD